MHDAIPALKAAADGSVAGYMDILDFVQITQVDRESAKRYFLAVGLLSGRGGSQVFSVGTSSLNYEYPLDVEGSPHSDVGQDRQGRQILFWNYSQIYGTTKRPERVALARYRHR